MREPTSPVVHLVECDARTYLGQFVARCGHLVSYRDEARRLELKLAVTCERCLSLQTQDESAIGELQEMTR